MATICAVDVAGERRTTTVLGPDLLPIVPVEQFLEHLRVGRWAPNTIRSYAQSLQVYFSFLELIDLDWADIDATRFGAFLTWLRTGLLPGATALHPREDVRRPSTVSTRAAAVLSFYRYQLDAHDVPAGRRLYRQRPSRMPPHRQPNYRRGLLGVAPAQHDDVPIFRLQDWQRRPTPVLTPEQVAAIMQACGGDPETGEAPGPLRDRLVLETLHETGMRLGECLALKHKDWVVGAGKTAYIDVVPRDDHPHGYTVKRARPRRIYISDRLAGIYGEYVWRLCDRGAADAHDPLDNWWVFVNCSQHGELFKPMHEHSLRAKIKAIKRELGAATPAGWTPHWFRHTHATTLLLAGVPPHVVMRRLGHQDVQTTLETYGWVTEDAELRLLADWRTATAGWAVEPAAAR